MIRKAFALLVALVVIMGMIAPAEAYSVGASKTKWEMSMNEQVKLWLDELAKNDKRFTTLQSSTYHSRTLGPNSKQWLLTFHNAKGESTGYFVVGQANPTETYKWTLIEYGLGNYTLFVEQEDMTSIDSYFPVYHNPFELYWFKDIKEKEVFRHHLSGEELPVEVKAASLLNDTTKINKLEEVGIIKDSDLDDPYAYVFWLTKPALKENQVLDVLSSISTRSVSPMIVFESTSYEGAMQEAFTVTGYHKWDQEYYISIIEHDIIRFIPYTVAEQHGNFFVSDM